MDTEDAPNKISRPLLILFMEQISPSEKHSMLQDIYDALSNEDVIRSLSELHFKSLIDCFLKMFSIEKIASLKSSTSLTKENINLIQKNISLLLNSKDYTTIIVSFIQVCKEGLPQDFSKELNEERKQFLRALMRCVVKIVQALTEEDAESVRPFDVLYQMFLLFKAYPAENLTQELPSI